MPEGLISRVCSQSRENVANCNLGKVNLETTLAGQRLGGAFIFAWH